MYKVLYTLMFIFFDHKLQGRVILDPMVAGIPCAQSAVSALNNPISIS